MLRRAYKHLKCCNRFWYKPKAWFTSFAKSFNKTGAEFGVAFGLFFLLILGFPWGAMIIAPLWSIYMLYLIVIDKITGVEPWL